MAVAIPPIANETAPHNFPKLFIFPLKPNIQSAFEKAYVEKVNRATKTTVLKISYCTITSPMIENRILKYSSIFNN